MINNDKLKDLLCSSFCNSVRLKETKAGTIVSLPMKDRDGDGFSIYIKDIPAGFRLSDGASTLMRLSYEHDIDSMLKGNRGRLFDLILSEAGLEEDDGELYKEVSADNLVYELFDFTKGLSRLSDLGLWTQHRTASTFYEDLKAAIYSSVPQGINIYENYVVPNIPQGENYPVDFYIEASKPLYIMGAGNPSQLKLATIVLQHLTIHTDNFDSMVVLSERKGMPEKDIDRLMSAANDIVPSIEDIGTIKKKILHRIA
ncbi:DUF1828 domain-containing protein [Acinetobacter baumannii]|uniref:DUF1828 domain-containing protein n=1 Tax=Acinetobacter baumannii TaxID=470 RepID=UPI0023405309|nr:DUF1828 domain-containing protein [Acinetobacter baumannii]MDC5297793.1 DUF1828 domain-containing protein [Acinetobacter baumannii]MEC6739831.1 DUF1828 domain-containing protein [Acinetobacter baumannii]